MSDIYIGIPGWRYAPWRGDFYPKVLKQRQELAYASRAVSSMTHWEKRIRSWASGAQPLDAQRVSKKQPSKRSSRDLFCYFDNDIKVHAPFDARRLLEKLALNDTLEVTPGEMAEKLT